MVHTRHGRSAVARDTLVTVNHAPNVQATKKTPTSMSLAEIGQSKLASLLIVGEIVTPRICRER
jgi:hypothetical protein